MAVEPSADAFVQFLKEQGLAHEHAVLAQLSAGNSVQKATSVDHTRRLMAERVPVIYQPQLLAEQAGITGQPDFLILHASGDYQAADAKLAQRAGKTTIQVQLGVYRRLLGNALPALVFLGDGSEAEIGDDADEVAGQFLADMRSLLTATTEPDVRYGHSRCTKCPYYTHCLPGFEAAEDLSLLYGLDARAVEALEAIGIDTITKLAAAEPADIPDLHYLKGQAKKRRAVLQAKSYLTGEVFELNPVMLPHGHWVHFDIEDNPQTASGDRHVYLWGFLAPADAESASGTAFEYVWTDDEAEDERGWLQFLAQVERYRQQYSDLVLAHYASHERTMINAYAARYGMQDHATVTWLLGNNGPLFDLRNVVTKNLVLPLQGYGLKDICKHKGLVNFQWQDDDSGSQWSVVQFNRFLEATDPEERARLKTDILRYNQDDVTATWRLEQWLRLRTPN